MVGESWGDEIFMKIRRNICDGRGNEVGVSKVVCELCGDLGETEKEEFHVEKVLAICLLPKPPENETRNSMQLCGSCRRILRNILAEYSQLERLRREFLFLQAELMGILVEKVELPVPIVEEKQIKENAIKRWMEHQREVGSEFPEFHTPLSISEPDVINVVKLEVEVSDVDETEGDTLWNDVEVWPEKKEESSVKKSCDALKTDDPKLKMNPKVILHRLPRPEASYEDFIPQKKMKKEDEECWRTEDGGGIDNDASSDEYSTEKRKVNKQALSCSLCPRTFVAASLLRAHSAVHFPYKGAHECSHCCWRAHSLKTLKAHLLEKHRLVEDSSPSFECPSCLSLFSLPFKRSVHLRRTHSGGLKDIHCAVCPSRPSFPSAEDLQSHAASSAQHLTSLNEPNIQCNLCYVKAASVEELSAHLKTEEHLKILEELNSHDHQRHCFLCAETFETNKALVLHRLTKGHRHQVYTERRKREAFELSSKETQPTFPCFCGKSFGTQVHFDLHRKRVHNNDDGFTCEECGKVFLRNKDFINHRRSHGTLPKPFLCATCGKHFTYKYSLELHMKTHEGNSFPCRTCAKVFKTEVSVRKHQRRQHSTQKGKPVRAAACPHCDESFSTPKYLRRHLCTEHKAIHLKETPFVCRFCFHTYAKEEELEEHMGSHDDLKCPQCPKVCSTREKMIQHLRKHTKERPFKCSECGKGFQTHTNLKEHSYTHVGRPFQCELCKYSFIRKTLLDKHHAKRHS